MKEAQEKMQELPQGWIWAKLGDVSTIEAGGTPSTKDPDNFGGDISWITPADLSGFDGKFISRGARNVSEKGLRSSSAKILPAGTVIFSSRAPIGYVAIAQNPICTNQGCKNFIPSSGISSEYIFHYLKGNRSLAESYASGTTFLELSAKKAAMLPIPIPPSKEQHRIVSRIEELFSRLDAGVEELQKAKGQLQRYRQSVLKAAMDGKLTAIWRENHKNEIESTPEPQIKMNVDLSIIKSISQNELPKGWYWTTFNQVSERITVGHVGLMKNEYVEDGIPFLRSQNVRENRFDPQGLKYISIKFHYQLKKSKLDPRDLVIVRSGVNAGNACVIPDYIKDANCSDLVIIKRPYAIDPHYGAFYINSIAKLFISNQEVGSAIRHFNTKSVAKMPIIVPPLMEQHIMIDEIGRHFSITNDSEMAINNILNNVGKMQQSILRKAFEGKLITQDPNDEPAGVLLERIKAKKSNMEYPKNLKRSNNIRQMRLPQ